MIRSLLLLAAGAGLALAATPVYTYKIVKTYPHDRGAFTQGLEYHDGMFYEGTGLNGRSSLRLVRLEDGRVLKETDLGREYFGEGITVFNGEIVQLTWQSQIGFVYGKNDFRMLRRFAYKGEGWGLTNDGKEIYMSDGTAQIRVLDPKTLAEKRRITVRDGGREIDQLNELEYINGEIYANIWQTDRIARISPVTGKVIAWIDLSGILSPLYRAQADVLNGIAYDKAGKRLFITGKLWPTIFEIQLVPKGR